MVISDFKVSIALGLPFPQIHLSVGGGGGGQQASSLSTQAVEFPQVLLVLHITDRLMISDIHPALNWSIVCLEKVN